MKTSSLALMLLTCCLTAADAQATPQFERAWRFTYQSPGDNLQFSHGLVGTPDGGVVTMMSSAPTAAGGAGEAVFAKFTENGERAWEYTSPMHICASSACFLIQQPNADVDSSGNIYAVVSDSVSQLGGTRLLKLSPNGSLLWDVAVTSAAVPTVYGSFVKVDPMDHPIVGGTHDIGLYPYSAAFRFDPNGNLDWSSGGTDRCDVTGMAMGPSGEVALYGRNDYPTFAPLFFGMIHVYSPNGGQQYLTGLSSDGFGTINFGTYWGDTVNDAVFDSAGNLHAFTNGSFGAEWFHEDWVGFAVASFDPTGGQLYRTAVDSPRATSGTRIAVDAGNNAYVIGTERVTEAVGSDYQTNIWKVDTAGVVAWQATNSAGQMGSSYGLAVDVTPLGNVLAMSTDDQNTVHYSLDPSGGLVWQTEEPTGPTDTFLFYGPSCDVVADVDGMAFTQEQLGDSVRITKFVPGGLVGTSFCGPAVQNSSGSAGRIEAIGTVLASENNLTLRLSELPGNTFAMLLNSQTQGSLPMLGGGQGTLCLGGSIGRYIGPNQLRRTLLSGTSSLRIDTTRIPNGQGTLGVSAGQTWNFQAWFRDVNPAVTSNLTDGVSVVFQ